MTTYRSVWSFSRHDHNGCLLAALRQRVATGEFAALRLTDLLQENELGRWIPELHVADAKRPNDRGEVPLGGAY